MSSKKKSDHDEEAPALPQSAPLKRKTSRQKREEMMQAARSRTHSNGSTLGAFYQNETPGKRASIVKPEKRASIAKPNSQQHQQQQHGGGGGLKKRRSSKKPPKEGGVPSQVPAASKPKPFQAASAPANNNTGSDLGDIASMAMAGLGDDLDFGDLMGGGPAPPIPSGKPPKKKTSKSRSPPSGLPTIKDDSEINHGPIQFDPKMLGSVGSGPRRASSRQSTVTVDSLRVSDVSSNLEDDAAAMLADIDRGNSMFVSDVSDVGFLAGFNPTMTERSANNDKRVSLLGSHILDNPSPPSSRSKRAPKLPPQSSKPPEAQKQQQDIANFAAMLHADYGAAADTTSTPPENKHPLKSKEIEKPQKSTHTLPYAAAAPATSSGSISLDEEEEESDEMEPRESSFFGLFDLNGWLVKDVKFDDNGVPYFSDGAKWTLAGLVRSQLFNPISPEFTSLQQFNWAVILGIAMGFYTAFWKEIIEHSVELMWKELPEALLEGGMFTDLDGSFPLYHWMWICPAFWGGLLSYIFAVLPTPIPGQNEWIENVHKLGVQDSETFLMLFVLSTLGMASGLSLGPELPLVLTAGMIGSWLGIQCKQSVLQARVMNITCASAAVGGFFGFPMAGALFVMEIPHRMGLQYFEALSPATIASIVAVLCNRLVTGNDVTGYYSYPFLTMSLPSEIFTSAIVFGLFGALVGTLYALVVLKLKGGVHDWFHAPHDDHDHGPEHQHEDEAETEESTREQDEKTPLILKEANGKKEKKKRKKGSPAEPPLPLHKRCMKSIHKLICCVIPYEPNRAAVAGTISGALVGTICMFVPHVMFWGEAQLQTLIDKGRTPLPVFGQEDEPTAALTANAYCMIDPNDPEAVKAGFGMGCAAVITLAKIVVTGLSLGTGIIGGHFWGPLFSGCAASHFLTDVVELIDGKVGFGGTLAAYPCVTILCTMGSTHVVTFRAHTAIMLILTLTISTFDPEDSDNVNSAVAGDYSAVFPLLVVSVFVSLMVSRSTVFYKAQRSRGDIMALPEVLCEPGKEGMPMVLDYEGGTYDEYDDSDYSSDGEGDYVSDADIASQQSNSNNAMLSEKVTQADIEKEFSAKVGAMAMAAPPQDPIPAKIESAGSSRSGRNLSSESFGQRSRGISPLPPRPPSGELKGKSEGGAQLGELSSARLDELLAAPLDEPVGRPIKPKHRRIQSAPDVDFGKRFQRERSQRKIVTGAEDVLSGGGPVSRHARSDSVGSQASGKVMRIATVGHLSVEQPSLMDQARQRSASSIIVESRHVRTPSMPSRVRRPGHSRNASASSIGSLGPPLQVNVTTAVAKNGVSPSEVERAFASAVNQEQRSIGNNGRTADGSVR